MTHGDWISELTVMMAAGGFAFGLLYFVMLERTVIAMVSPRGWLAPISLTLGRLGAAAGLLILAAKLGAPSLIAAFCGFLLARMVALRSYGRVR